MTTRSDQFREFLFWNELHHLEKMAAIQYGLFGEDDETMSKNLEVYNQNEEKVVDQMLKQLNTLIKRSKS